MKNIENSLAVFCLATYGEGDPTDNAMEFWEWIQGDVDLAGLNYGVSKCLSLIFMSSSSCQIFGENKINQRNITQRQLSIRLHTEHHYIFRALSIHMNQFNYTLYLLIIR